MAKRHSTKSKGRSWWSAQLTAWRSSGLSQRAFCERRGINQSTFSKWRRRFASETSALVSIAEPRFVAVELPAAERPLVRVSLGAVTVDFETLPPPAWVAELAARGGAGC
jgi:transposase-like protein